MVGMWVEARVHEVLEVRGMDIRHGRAKRRREFNMVIMVMVIMVIMVIVVPVCE